MSLSPDLVSQFVKITNDNKKQDTKKENITYGIVQEKSGDEVLLKLDGASDENGKLPATTTVSVNVGDRVIVMIKNHSAVITGNLGNPATTTEYVDGATGEIKQIANNANKNANNAINKVGEFEIAIANKVDTKELTAELARINNLETNTLLTNTVKANEANVKILNTDTANIEKALVKEIDAETGNITYAKIKELDAATADVKDLKAGVADINTLMFGSATGDTIHTNFSNSVIAQVGDAQIKSAMIQDIDAGKIQSGSIDTNKVNIQSDDGSFVIKDNRLQIKEGETVRVQIGKDGAGDYSVSICDKEGKVVFSENGVTGDGIPDNVIVNDMVSDNANIHASKLDIDSLFEEINSDGTNVIKSTKITVDEQGQTLEAAFKKMATTESVDKLSQTVSSQGAQITANTEAINSKVWQQDIETAKNEIGETTAELSTKYSELEQNLNGFQTTVSDIDTRLVSAESSITQLSDKIIANVTETTNLGTRMSTVEQTASELTARLDATDINVANAGKTATNYLNFSSSGLVIGDMTADTLGKNVLIDSDSVDIRNGTTTLASFGADYLYLAKNSRDATIDLCNGLAKMYHTIDDAGYSIFNIDTTYGLSYIKMSAPMHDMLVLENTAATNGVIIKGVIDGTTVGGFGLVREGYMVRYGSDADDDNPVENIVLDTGNFLTEMDDGWHYTGGYGENFTQYNNEEYAKVRYRKIGGMVEVRGVMRPTTIIEGSTTQYELFQLPSGYRPDSYIYQRCSGSYAYTWLLTISTGGKFSFSRYGDGSSYVDVDTTAWLPFQVTYFVG